MNVLVSLLLVALDAGASPPAPDTLVSPEVHPDHRITFRLRAPRAAEVTVAGEWTQNKPEKMNKDGQGIWSATVGPVEPNIYIYVFNVDGVTLVDPVNPLIKLRARTAASMVEVPGGQPWEFREVPHGAVQIQTHASPVLGGAMRQIFVYTPPAYDSRRTAPYPARYPVLYLLHGNNDLAAGWTMAGRANLILDNLIAEHKVVPMIVVMPWGHALPFGARPPAGRPGNNDVFEQYLIKDVMPLVEGTYRVAAGRGNRAVVGLSMGGAQALQVVMGHRDLFAAVGMFGAGMKRAEFDARYQTLPAGRDKLGVFFIGVGKEDGALPRARELSEALRARGVETTYREIDGGHTYPVWRKLLVEAAPLLFRK